MQKYLILERTLQYWNAEGDDSSITKLSKFWKGAQCIGIPMRRTQKACRCWRSRVGQCWHQGLHHILLPPATSRLPAAPSLSSYQMPPMWGEGFFKSSSSFLEMFLALPHGSSFIFFPQCYFSAFHHLNHSDPDHASVIQVEIPLFPSFNHF